jgi:predicted transcriptional regulator of viral defense system
MGNNMNEIYAKFYKQKVFTLYQANKIIRNKQVCQNALNRLVKRNMIKRIRKTIYHIVPLDDSDFEPNNVQVASDLRRDTVISCNTALSAYKLWKAESTVYILSKYASKIRLKEDTYRILKDQYNIGINKMEYDTGYTIISIKITDIERTILDCLWNRTIKIEDLIKVLRTNKIDFNIKNIIKYLERYKKPILYNKLGFLLEAAKQNLDIHDEELETIRKKLTKKTFYLKEKGLTLIRPRYRYYQKWNLMIPEDLMDMVKPKTII